MRTFVLWLSLIISAGFLPAASDLNILFQEQEELNKTVWSAEQKAQEHERYFIRLWDELRNSEDAYAVLKKVPFGKLNRAEVASSKLHVENSATRLRAIVSGKLNLQWQLKPTDDGMFIPQSIDASNLTITSRNGEPFFKELYLDGAMPTPYYDALDGYPAYLLLNDGDGTRFTENTIAAGIRKKRNRRTFSNSFFDYDSGKVDSLEIV